MIDVECDESLKMNSYPGGAIAQIITNLVYNSYLHGYEIDSKGLVKIVVTQSDGHTIINFQDNGTGMTDQVVTKLFDPFFTTKRGKGGSGLGMYIVYNLVNAQLQGTISCESHLDEGTLFIIELPNNL